MTLVYKLKTEEKEDDPDREEDKIDFFDRVNVPAYVEAMRQEILEK